MHPIILARGDAILIVDLQNDFLPGGALGINGGDLLIPVINDTIKRFRKANLPIYASRDWHPSEHCSFREQGGPWPRHCVAQSPGAEFAADLDLPPDTRIISKATDTTHEAYSAFDRTALASCLRADGIKRLFICGLATEYCVLWTTRDAIGLGFSVVVLNDAIGAIENQVGDEARAISTMKEIGASVVSHIELGA